MSPIKAVIFDFIGTLTNLKGYSLEAAKMSTKMKLYSAIVNVGFKIDPESFLEAYILAHERHRVIRYQKLIEVTNAVWISEALNNLGQQTTPDDPRIKTAVNIFFKDYLNSIELRPYAKKTLEEISTNYKLGLISNFTYAPVIHVSLRKLNINQFFNAVLVSQEVGWRKPHPEIFNKALRRLKVSQQEAIYVGDSPLEDIQGAKNAGIKAIFTSSQFHTFKNLRASQQKPAFTVHGLYELHKRFQEFACFHR